MVKVKYVGLPSIITGKAEESIDIREPNITVAELVGLLVRRYGKPFENLVLDPTKNTLKIPVLADGVPCQLYSQLRDGGEVTFLLLMFGG